METRRLGELNVSAIGLGCMNMSFGYGKPDPQECERALQQALDVGYTFLDTASAYGMGHNEKLIGRVLGAQRNKFVLASKCGIKIDDKGGRYVDCTPENVRRSCEQSLGNLQTDCIDLYYLHRLDQNVPIEDSVGELSRLVEEGKIRCIGLSEMSTKTLRRAHAVHPVTAVQSEYSLWTRDPEYKMLDACSELGIGFVPFSPLGRGFLTGVIHANTAYDDMDMRRFMPRFLGDNLHANLQLLASLKQLAQRNKCTVAQFALAWLLAQGDKNMVPIPGTKHVDYVIENAGASEVKISCEDLQAARELFDGDAVKGPRYAPEFEISLDPEDD